MDNSNMSKNRNNEHLGVNKMGKNIRKSPLHQPNFANSTATAAIASGTARQQPQPQVYNISKNDFRNIVQQLTGSPSHDSLPRPPNNPSKPPSMRLQKIRPPPLAPMNRPPHVYPPAQAPAPMPPSIPAQPQVYYNNSFARPGQYGQPSPTPLIPGDSLWANAADSPISAYMRYLQNSIIDSGPRHPQTQPQFHPQVPGQVQAQHQHQHQHQHQPPLPPSTGLLPNPAMPPPPSPGMNFPGLLPSPTSQFLLPSPGFFNLLSPRSPYPLLSPGIQYPQPLTPNFPFSPMAQPGILGPGPHAPPLSPGIVFPLSPSGFFPMSSPRWRAQ